MCDGQLAEKQLKTEYDLKRMAELQVTADSARFFPVLFGYSSGYSSFSSFLGTLLADDHDWLARRRTRHACVADQLVGKEPRDSERRVFPPAVLSGCCAGSCLVSMVLRLQGINTGNAARVMMQVRKPTTERLAKLGACHPPGVYALFLARAAEVRVA